MRRHKREREEGWERVCSRDGREKGGGRHCVCVCVRVCLPCENTNIVRRAGGRPGTMKKKCECVCIFKPRTNSLASGRGAFYFSVVFCVCVCV
jgi:hypothetical protein